MWGASKKQLRLAALLPHRRLRLQRRMPKVRRCSRWAPLLLALFRLALLGSSPTVLKLYGDINGDGRMMYVEYTCTQGTASAPGSLYRNQMPYDQATAKTANNPSMILLSNVLTNPKDASGNTVPCFAYQVQPLGSGTCVTNVAVTLTVQTQNVDPQTRQLQTETKALLNVGPRNIVEVYGTASLVDPTRAQPMPATVSGLLLP